jgi:hypothetical protein
MVAARHVAGAVMASIYDGGSAFPRQLPQVAVTPDEALRIIEAYRGMSMRDYFAGQALASFAIAHPTITSKVEHALADERFDRAARAAYRYADAMLAEREKGGA